MPTFRFAHAHTLSLSLAPHHARVRVRVHAVALDPSNASASTRVPHAWAATRKSMRPASHFSYLCRGLASHVVARMLAPHDLA